MIANDLHMDELSFLSQTYQRSSEKLSEYNSKSTYTNAIMKSVSVKKLLEESSFILEEEFQIFKDEYGLELNFSEQTIVCLASIDSYRQLLKELDSKDGWKNQT